MSDNILIMEAIAFIDDVYLKKYFEMKSRIAHKKETAKKLKIMKWSVSIAACFLVLSIVIPVIMNFTQHHTLAPSIKYYETISQVDDDLGYHTLYSNLELNGSSISVSYKSDENGDAIIESPLQLLIRHSYSNESSTDKVNYYILFDKDSVDQSYIGGYEEQGLTKKINDVTIHYSEIFDGSNHTQAKFMYEGDLYVVDIISTGNINLDFYLESLFK